MSGADASATGNFSGAKPGRLFASLQGPIDGGPGKSLFRSWLRLRAALHVITAEY